MAMLTIITKDKQSNLNSQQLRRNSRCWYAAKYLVVRVDGRCDRHSTFNSIDTHRPGSNQMLLYVVSPRYLLLHFRRDKAVFSCNRYRRALLGVSDKNAERENTTCSHNSWNGIKEYEIKYNNLTLFYF